MIENDNIAIQMRKGILEYLILLIISKGEVYASDIISHLKNHDLLVVEGTLYPLLSRLKKDQLLTYAWIESPSGPPRKYYTLTSLGFETMKRMEMVRNQLNTAIISTQSMKKSITSPAATGECVNVLMNINFDKEGIEKLVSDQDCCLVWGGSLDLAPADDKLIKVQYPLSMQSRAKVVSSIMAKKYAMGITHSLIDIPVGPTAKVTTMEEAKDWKQKFEYVGEKLGMKMQVEITKADEVIGKGVGAVMQVREVLRILQQHPDRALDLENKVLHLAAKIIESVGMAKGKKALEIAINQLTSGKAREKMQSIISAQNGNPNITSETLNLGTHTYEIIATHNGTLKSMNLHDINAICRKLGCPIINEAGIYLHKKTGDKISKGEVIATLYALDETKLKLGIERFQEKSPFVY